MNLFNKKNLQIAFISATLFFLGIAITAIFFWVSKEDSTREFAERIIRDFEDCEQYAYNPTQLHISDRYACYVKTTLQATKESGLQPIVQAVNEYFVVPTGNLEGGSACHDLSHIIGDTAVRIGRKGSDILEQCQDLCGFGCLNGAAHVIFSLVRTLKTQKSFVMSIVLPKTFGRDVIMELGTAYQNTIIWIL